MVHIVRALFSNSKRKAKFETNGYKKLPPNDALELLFLEIDMNNGLDFSKVFVEETETK